MSEPLYDIIITASRSGSDLSYDVFIIDRFNAESDGGVAGERTGINSLQKALRFAESAAQTFWDRSIEKKPRPPIVFRQPPPE